LRVRAFAIDTRDPGDVDELRRLLDAGTFAAADVIAVIGKTEGNGGRNDFSRGLAMAALEHLFAPRLGVAPEQVQDRVIFSFSGGTEGVVAPHMLVLVREGERDGRRRATKRLAVAIGHTRAFAPEEIGRMAQIEETARVVRDIAATLDLDALADVHLVQMKGAIPHFSPEQAQAAARAGRALRCDMVGSRAASALGVALALGEVEHSRLSDEVVCNDWSLYSGIASCSAKPGLERTEIVRVRQQPDLDRRPGDSSTGILADILDSEGVRAVAAKLGLQLPVDPATSPLLGVFAKSEADPRGRVRGRRHTMLSDDDIGDTRYSRCVLTSVLAATLGDTRVYVSTRAEHHGPLGGGPLAIVARLPEVST
jgi:cyanuric acid amidohydrolase